MPAEHIEIDPEIYADIEESVHEMQAAGSISELSQAITDRLNDFKEQAIPHETTYEAIALLAEAAVGVELIRRFPTSDMGDYQRKQDALMCHADDVGGHLSSMLVHKDQTGIPEAKVVYDQLVAHGLDAIAENPEAILVETLDV